MAVSTSEFWDLLVTSQLLTPGGVARRQEQLAAEAPQKQEDAEALAEWLIEQRVISAYQSKVLLAGRPGPFVYGDYVVYDRLTRGRFQGAFKALHPVTRYRVVLLFHAGRQAEDTQAWAALARDVDHLAQISHPNLSRMYHAAASGTYKFTAIEYHRGRSAQERLAAESVPWSVACRMVWQAACGLEQLMQSGELHEAVRPDNLMLDGKENVKLLLPAVARAGLMSSGAAVGEAGVAASRAPELAEPGRVANPQTEVYSLGWTLYRLIVGSAPAGDSAALQETQATTASLELYGVPAEVSKIAAQMTSRDLARRFKHPRQVSEALAAALRRFDPVQLEPRPAVPAAHHAAYDEWLRKRGFLHPPGESGSAPVADADVPIAIRVGDESAGDKEPGIFIVPKLRETLRMQTERAREAAQGRNGLLIAIAVGVVLLGVAWRLLFSGPARVDAPTWTVESSAKAPQQRPTRARGDRGRPPSAVTPAPVVAEDTVDSAEKDQESGSKTSNAEPPRPSVEMVPDDGQTLWASPTEGIAISAAYLAPGVQAILFARPVQLLRHPEGKRIAAALELLAGPAISRLESVAGAALADIEEITIAWTEPIERGAAVELAPMYVLRFAQPGRANEAVASAIGGSSGSSFRTPLGEAYFPPQENGAVMVIGTRDQIQESKRLAGSQPPLRRELEKLVLATDSERMITLVTLPEALDQASGAVRPLAEGLDKFLGDARAAAVSAYLDADKLFLEVRIEGQLDDPAARLAHEYRGRVANVHDAVESYLATFDLQPYGKRVLLRFPPMLKVLDEFTRSGMDGDQAVLRCYLPAAAAHNLLMATELALAEQSSLESSPSGKQPAGAESLESRLQRVASLSFASDTLENALGMLAGDLGVKVEILGADLQAEGITRNQSFSLDERNRPAAEILRTILRKASPDGKLVYVIKQADDGGEVLGITTRAAAVRRGDRVLE